MNTFPNACPHCDAGPGPYVNSYLCGTYLRAGHDARKHQTKRCVTRQLLVWVEKARKAEARCKRLEEAGDVLANAADKYGIPYHNHYPEIWREAKEAKP